MKQDIGRAPDGAGLSQVDSASSLAPPSFDPSREEERAAVVAWLREYQRANSEAQQRAREPAQAIDLRGRANSCQMHAIWIALGKHLDGGQPHVGPEQLRRIREAVRDLTDATLDNNGQPVPNWATVDVHASDLREVLGLLSDNDGRPEGGDACGSVVDDSAALTPGATS